MDLGRRFFGLVDVAEVDDESLRMKLRLVKVVGIIEVIGMPLELKVDIGAKPRSSPKVVLWGEAIVDVDARDS